MQNLSAFPIPEGVTTVKAEFKESTRLLHNREIGEMTDLAREALRVALGVNDLSPVAEGDETPKEARLKPMRTISSLLLRHGGQLVLRATTKYGEKKNYFLVPDDKGHNKKVEVAPGDEMDLDRLVERYGKQVLGGRTLDELDFDSRGEQVLGGRTLDE